MHSINKKKRSKKKVFLYGILIIIILLQFIRPERNIAAPQINNKNDMGSILSISKEAKSILEVSCYDCHSNNTNYPWYTNIQPIGLWMQMHVDDGKRAVNFSKFGSYSKQDQHHTLEEIIREVENEKMPLPSYLQMHKDASISNLEKEQLINWAKERRDELAKNFNY
jgi:hypothetical protein